MKKSLLITPIILGILLSACSSGGNNSSQGGEKGKSEVTGQVIDGYLVGATVFLDKNLNAKLDDDEPNTTTEAGGRYKLNLTQSERKNYPIVALINKDTQDTGDDDKATRGNSANASGDYVLSTPPGKSMITPFTTPIVAMLKKDGAFTNLDLSNEKNAELIEKLVNKTVKVVLSKIPNVIKKAQDKDFPLFENFITSDAVDTEKTQKLAEKITVVMAKVSNDAINKDDEIKDSSDAETAVSNAVLGENMLEALANDSITKEALAQSDNIEKVVKVIKEKSGKNVSIAEKPERNKEYVPSTTQRNAFAIYTKGSVYSLNVDMNRKHDDRVKKRETETQITYARQDSFTLDLDVYQITFNQDGSENSKGLGHYYNAKGELVARSKNNNEPEKNIDGILDAQGNAVWTVPHHEDTTTNIQAKGDNLIVTENAALQDDKTKRILVSKFEWGVTKKDYSNKSVKKLLESMILSKIGSRSDSDAGLITAKLQDSLKKLPDTSFPANSVVYAPATFTQLGDFYELDGEIKSKDKTVVLSDWEDLENPFYLNHARMSFDYAKLDRESKQVILYSNSYENGNLKLQEQYRLAYNESTRGSAKVITFKHNEWSYPKFIAKAKSGSSTIIVHGIFTASGPLLHPSNGHFNKASYDAIDALLKRAAADGEIELLKTTVYKEQEYTELKPK